MPAVGYLLGESAGDSGDNSSTFAREAREQDPIGVMAQWARLRYTEMGRLMKSRRETD